MFGYIQGYLSSNLTQSDTIADPAGPFEALYTGSGGTIKFTDTRGNVVGPTNVAAGVVLPFAIRNVWASTTTATGMLGLLPPGRGQ